MFAVLAALTAFAVADDPAANQNTAPQTQTAEERRTAEREAELDRVVCRREHVVGSNRPQRICMTVREWEHQRDLAQEQLRDGGHRQGDGSTVQTAM